MKYLSLSVNGTPILAPSGVATGGLEPGGTGLLLLQWGLVTFFTLISLFTLYVFIMSGVGWVMSQGDKAKVQMARTRITFAVLGLIIIFGSFFFVNVMGGIFGIKLLP